MTIFHSLICFGECVTNCPFVSISARQNTSHTYYSIFWMDQPLYNNKEETNPKVHFFGWHILL